MEALEVEESTARSVRKRSSYVQGKRSLARASIASVAVLSGSSRAEVHDDGDADDDLAGGLSAPETVANFVICAVGAGVVVFPKVMKDNGIVAAILLLFLSAFVCFECGRVILECCTMAEAQKGLAKGSLQTYEAVAEAAFGRAGTAALSVTKNGYFLGTILAYTVFLAAAVEKWTAFIPMGSDAMRSSIVRWLIVTPLFLSLATITDLKKLSALAPVGTAAVFTQAVTICIGSLLQAFQPVPTRTYTAPELSFGTVGTTISIFVFGFDAIVSLPAMRGQMREADELPSVLNKGMAIVALISGTIMGIGFAGFGNEVNDNVIDSLGTFMTTGELSLSSTMGSLASLGIMVNLLISVPIIFYNFTSFIESTKSSEGDALRTPMTTQNIAFRFAVMISLVLVGSAIPFAKQLIGLVSAVFGSFNSVLSPLAFFYKLRREAPEVQPLHPLRAVLHVVVVLVGSTALVFGTIGGVDEVLEKLKELSGAARPDALLQSVLA
eukprot:TRINITY_DN14978_c0_g1_i1.p1 TRINITY_DN14978_c0_g1~~TRINITY_DN14978_c0_g1_i1.p1  ORF type:complete len:496 (-),score=101.10 TRINITY_DN14978_c0_g1_i1:192-1679(-)